jgi:hypothetical protein
MNWMRVSLREFKSPDDPLVEETMNFALSVSKQLTQTRGIERLGRPARDPFERRKAEIRRSFRAAHEDLNDPQRKEIMVAATAAHAGITLYQLRQAHAAARKDNAAH